MDEQAVAQRMKNLREKLAEDCAKSMESGKLDEMEMAAEKVAALEEVSKEECWAWHSMPRKSRYEPYFDSVAFQNVPRHWLPDPTTQQLPLGSMSKIEVNNMAHWVLSFELDVICAAQFLIWELSGWWKNNMNAALIVNKILERYNVKYIGKNDHTYQLTALSILISQKRKSAGKEIFTAHSEEVA